MSELGFDARPHSGTKPPGAATIALGALVSLVLHGSIIGLVILGTMRSGEKFEEAAEEKMLTFEQVDLLALGEEKPPDALPRISNPARAKVKPDEVALEPPTEAPVPLPKPDEPEPDRAEVSEEEQKRRDKMLAALSDLNDPMRPSNEDLPEGAAEGIAGGTLSDAAMANLMGTYQAKLTAEIQRYWVVPVTISKDEVAGLKDEVSVYVRVSPEGYIVSFKFTKRSGNDQFDDSIERVLRRFQVAGGGKKLPVPENPEVRDAVVAQGLKLSSWEYTGT